MATINNADGKLVVLRSAAKEAEPYSNPLNESVSNLPPPPTPSIPTTARSADVTAPRSEVIIPTRRVVVIRNTKLPPFDPGSSDTGESGKSNSGDTAPVASDGSKSVYLIRRPIPPDSFKIVKFYKPDQETQTNTTESTRTPTPPPPPPEETINSFDQARSSSPLQTLPSFPESSQPSTPPENVPRYAPYLRRSRSKLRTPSPVRIGSTYRSPSSTRARSSNTKTEEIQTQPVSTITLENERQEIPNHPASSTRSMRRKKDASARTASAKSIVLVNPEDQSVVVIENSFSRTERFKPPIRQTRYTKKSQSNNTNQESQSTEVLVETTESRPCLDCLSRHICLVIVICLLLLLIGLAGVGVSLYFLITGSSLDSLPMIIGIAVGAALAALALIFLYIVLGCIGARDGYFSYDDSDTPQVGGRVFALIPPTHPNAHLYVPHEFMKTSESNHILPVSQKTIRPRSNVLQRQTSFRAPVSAVKSYSLPQTIYEPAATPKTRPKPNNLTIEVPERLLPARKLSPKSRERSLTQVIKNINHIYDDVKKQYNGDVSNKVIVTVDKNALQSK